MQGCPPSKLPALPQLCPHFAPVFQWVNEGCPTCPNCLNGSIRVARPQPVAPSLLPPTCCAQPVAPSFSTSFPMAHRGCSAPKLPLPAALPTALPPIAACCPQPFAPSFATSFPAGACPASKLLLPRGCYSYGCQVGDCPASKSPGIPIAAQKLPWLPWGLPGLEVTMYCCGFSCG